MRIGEGQDWGYLTNRYARGRWSKPDAVCTMWGKRHYPFNTPKHIKTNFKLQKVLSATTLFLAGLSLTISVPV